MAAALVSGQIATIQGNSASFGVAFPSNNTSGNFIAVTSNVKTAGDPATATITDSQSNTYNNAGNQRHGDLRGQIDYAFNIAGGANTVTTSGTTQTRSITIAEYTAVQSFSDPIDAASVSSADFTAVVNAGSLNPSGNNLYIGAHSTVNSGSFTWSPGSDMTLAVDAGTTNANAQTFAVGSGAKDIEATWGASAVTVGLGAAFAEAVLIHIATTTFGAQSDTLTISSVVVSGTDRALILKVSIKGNATIDSATFNGSENFSQEITDINGDARSVLLSLTNPTVTTADVVVNLSGSSRSVVAVSLYNGVDQTNPFRSGTLQSANGTNDSPTVNVTGNVGDIIVDVLCQVSAGPDTATADHIERHNIAETGGGTDTRGASQELNATGGSDAMGWSMSDSDNWSVCAGALQIPAAGSVSLLVDDLTQSQTIDQPALTQANVLLSDDLDQGQTIDEPNLSQSHQLISDDLDQSQTIDEPTLDENTLLISDDLDQSQTIDEPSLTQANVLSTDDIDQSQTIDKPDLTQANVLSTNDIDQAQTIDNITLSIAGALSVDDLDQAQTIDLPVLTQAHILSVDDITQNQTIDNVVLAIADALLVDNLTQAQTIDLANIIQKHILLVNGLDQSQSIDQPGLSIGITVNDLTQAQTLDVVSLVQANILSVDNLTQAQLLDNILLGGIAVGFHKGEVLVFSAYNGIITSTNAQTGEVKIFNAVDLT